MSQLLLDTHVALWWLVDERLEVEAREAIADPANRVLVSIVSAWEVAIKQGLGRLVVREDYLEVLQDVGVDLLGLTREHVRGVSGLPQHHRDPFDRMLVAQAQEEGLTLVSRDRRLSLYDVPVLRA